MSGKVKITRVQMINLGKNHLTFIFGIVPTNPGEGKLFSLNPHLLPNILTYTKLPEPL